MKRKAKSRDDKRDDKWMQNAASRPGAFSAKAKRAGMSTHAFAEKERNAPGRTGKQARLALVFEKTAKRRHKRTSHSTGSHRSSGHHRSSSRSRMSSR